MPPDAAGPVPARPTAPAAGALPPWADGEDRLAVEEDGAGDAAIAAADALLASGLDEKLLAAAFAADMVAASDAPCPCASVEPLFEFVAPAGLPSDAVCSVAATLRARLLPLPCAIASLAVVAVGCGGAPFGACTNAAPDMASTSVEGGPELTALLWLPDLFATPVASGVEDGGCAASAETTEGLGGVPEGTGAESRSAGSGVSAGVPALLLLPCVPAFAALAADDEDLALLCGAGGASATAVAPACVSIRVDAEELLPGAAPGSGTTGRVASPVALLGATGATLLGAVAAASAPAGAGADDGTADDVAAPAAFGFGAGACVTFAAWAARRR